MARAVTSECSRSDWIEREDRSVRGTHDRLGGVEGEATSKDGALRERRLFRVREQVEGALQRASHRALDGSQGAGRASHSRQQSVEAEDLGGRGRELDGERVAFQRRGDGLGPLGDPRVDFPGSEPRALEEERCGGREVARRTAGRQRPQLDGDRARRARFPTRRGDHLKARGTAAKGLDERPDQRREVLGAIEDEQSPPELPQCAGKGDLGRRRRFERDVSRRRQRAHDVAGVARFGELRIDDRVPGRVFRLGGLPDGFAHEPGLADAWSPPHRHDRRPRSQTR